ncbi:sugar ABC transporter permease [Candidatus Borkfalkia ceftriaxoniphila]|jgi:ABC transporter, permease protein|uniref:Sugar ABC transporter permease n=1 Tax=Candidatus Borkfalkia ceftriaxoniphila TaxID=2508949 RepID=A0A4Q2KBF6_9FIRM|nr:sugar ABC transporter permease [Candidatus Borkfalkia ceftriaxoniphila]RXZ61220.1 sugar ABC transporter permease [Candidatus Borkfalkia ceftriaxoniphila]
MALKNILGGVKNKIKQHYEKSGLLEHSSVKIKNPWKIKLFIFCMLALPIAQFLVFTVYINIDGILMTFQNVDFSTNEEKFVGFGNFAKFFRNFTAVNRDNFIKSIWNSFGYWPVTFLIAIPLQLLSAYILYKKVPASGFIIVMIFLPNLIPPAVLAQSFSEMLSIREGPLNSILMHIFGYTSETVPIWLRDEKFAMPILYMYSVWVGIGYNAVLMWGAMTRVPAEIVESAHLDGIGFVGEFFHITLPIMWPTLSMILMTSVGIPFSVYMHSLLLTNGGQAGTGTLGLMAIQTLRSGDMYYSATISVILSMVSIPLMLLARKVLNRIYEDVEV